MTETCRASRVDLEAFAAELLGRFDVPPDDAAVTAARIIDADVRGVESHGLMRLASYVRRLEAGGYNVRPDVRTVHETPVSALLDGDNGLGQVVMTRAVQVAIAKATACGLSWVGVRGSNHAGAGGVYAAMALEHRFVGIYMAIGNANHLPPWGGSEPLMSTNPIAFAIPAGERPDLVFDMATTAVSYGRVKVAAQRGETMPEGWMVDRAGRPLTDPARSADGMLLPVGGYKGYGLGLVIGALAGVLNGAAVGKSTIDFNADFQSATNTGHVIAVLRPDLFGEPSEFVAGMDAWLADLASSTLLPGVERIRVPGDRISQRVAEAEAQGIVLRNVIWATLEELAETWDVALPVRMR